MTYYIYIYIFISWGCNVNIMGRSLRSTIGSGCSIFAAQISDRWLKNLFQNSCHPFKNWRVFFPDFPYWIVAFRCSKNQVATKSWIGRKTWRKLQKTMKHETYWKFGKIWATLETIGKLWKEIWKNIGKKIGKHIGELFETTNPPSPAAIGACARRFKVGLGHPTSSDSHLQIPSGNLLHSYWKWPFIVDFPIKNGGCP